MNVGDFEMISRLVKERSGLLLTQDKAYLLARRLNSVARRHDFKGFDELARAVRLTGEPLSSFSAVTANCPGRWCLGEVRERLLRRAIDPVTCVVLTGRLRPMG